MNRTGDEWALLDLRGLVLHCFHAGDDPDAVKLPQGKLATPGYTLHTFSEFYLKNITGHFALNRIIAVHDGGNAYRQSVYPNYKANRIEPEPMVKHAMNVAQATVKEFLAALGIPQVTCPSVEGDDVLAHLSARLPGKKMIYTVDQDLIPLVSDTVSVLVKNAPRVTMDCDGAEVKAHHIPLYKSIVGDSSDGYIGVPGMGKKAWQNLLAEYGEDGLDELEVIVRDSDMGKLKSILNSQPGQHPLLAKLLEAFSTWTTAYDLACLHPELIDARRGKAFNRLKWYKRIPSEGRLQEVLGSCGCGYMLEDYGRFMPKQFLITAEDWEDGSLDEAEALFRQSRFIALDWETWAPEHKPFNEAARGEYVDMLGSRITGSGITCGFNHEYTFYFQWEHADAHNNIDKRMLPELLARIPDGTPVAIHNLYFEASVYQTEYGKSLPCPHDTKLMAQHVSETDSNSLKDLSKQWLNFSQTRYRDVVAYGSTMKDYTGADVFQYGADDPLVTAHLYDLFYVILNLEGSWEHVRDHEFPTVLQLADAYCDGVGMDWAEVEAQTREDEGTLQDGLASIRRLLQDHQDPDSIADGAANWLKELELDFDGDTRMLTQWLVQCRNADNLYGTVKANKYLWALLSDGIGEGDDWDTVQTLFIDTRARGRAALANQAKEAATYRAFSTETLPAKFSWCPKALNALAESYGLPGTVTDSTESGLPPWLDKLRQVDLNDSQVDFLCRVEDVVNHPKDRSKRASYKSLAGRYAAIGQGKVTKEGSELNLNSPKQMQEFLYAMLGLPIRLRALDISETRLAKGLPGAPQTNEDAILTALANGDAPEGSWQCGVLTAYLSAKKADTRLKLFYYKFPLWQHPLDGLVHPQVNSCGTETRRPSCTSPNMLQLSKRGTGVKIRRCIVPNPKLGHDMVCSIDWAAEELRVLADLSGDKVLTACYVGDDKLDVHGVTAAQMLRVNYADFMATYKDEAHPDHKKYSDTRKSAKNVNFGSSYGIGPAKLSRQLLCSSDEAKTYLEAKKEAYEGIELWRGRVKEWLHAKGYVNTPYGSRKHLYDALFTEDEGLLGYYERAAVNFLIQGLCADYLKEVLAYLWRAQTFRRHNATLIAPIYDEIVFSCHHSQAASLIREVYTAMVQGYPGCSIPMLAMPSVGRNFADQLEVLGDEYETLTDAKIMAAIDKAFETGAEKEAA